MAEEDFLDDDECLSDEAECLLDEEEDVCVSDVDEAGEVGADTVVGEVVVGIDFVDDDLAGETAPL